MEKNRKQKTFDYDELSHMNSTYNFSTMKRKDYQERFKSFNKESEKEEENESISEILKKTFQCLKIEKNNKKTRLNA